MQSTKKLFKGVLMAAVMLLTGCGQTSASAAESAAVSASESVVTSVAPTYEIASYRLTFKLSDGTNMKGVEVTLTDSDGNKYSDETSKGGYVKFEGMDVRDYKMTVDVPDDYEGYQFKDEDLVFDKTNTRQVFTAYTCIEKTKGLATGKLSNSTKIEQFDQMYDFKFTLVDYEKDADGNLVKDAEGEYTLVKTDYQLSALLETYQLVFINFWETFCSPCKNEFPYFEQLYNETDENGNYTYRDKVKFVCLCGGDSQTTVANFENQQAYVNTGYGTTYDAEAQSYHFGMGAVSGSDSTCAYIENATSTGYVPTDVFVDRDGQCMYREAGAVSSLAGLKAMVDPYLGTDEEYKASLNSQYIVDWGE